MTDKALFSYAEAVAYMGLSERWLRKAVGAGLITPARFGTRRLFRRTALDGLIEKAERDGVTLDSLAGVKPAAEADPDQTSDALKGGDMIPRCEPKQSVGHTARVKRA